MTNPSRQPWPLEKLKHGPGSRARWLRGCTCDVCIRPRNGVVMPSRVRPDRPLTHAERQKRLRDKLRGTPVPPGTKHGQYCRKVYGCDCAEAKAYLREARKRHRAAAANRRRADPDAPIWGRWTLDPVRQLDVVCWPPRDAGPEWRCPHPDHTLERAA